MVRGKGLLPLAVAGAIAVTALAATAPPATAGTGAGTANAAVSAGGPAACGGHAALRRALHRLTHTDGLAGAAVRVDAPGCGEWAAAAGAADLRTGRPMPVAGRIRIGSTTKTFTATVLLQLVAAHRVDLDATVDHYLPGLIDRNGYDGRRITVRQLLQHTSGLPDHVDALDFDHPRTWRTHDFTPGELVALALDQPRPARAWSYSTTNYIVLGMIIRKVTGNSPSREITGRIIRPLGLKDTYWPHADRAIEGPHPHGYERLPRGGGTVLTDTTDFNMTYAGVGGALVSSLADENRFFAALLGGRLLPPAQLAQMKATVPADPDRIWPGARYGLGLISTPLPCGGTYWGHGGTTPGFETTGGVAPDGRRVQLVINQNIDSARSFEDELATISTALCENR
ncbi:serine hydrolase [Streptomyces sp. HPF1205]|uniref:serine hydrolase domain-containing protein n=1 Tax=Streptomyces sp. HPF1205 TaxID=2873262 RepID=UPI001CEC0A87|nr:serine hydrolase domain-containing protein [Streptomyces sp. HPF1205]